MWIGNGGGGNVEETIEIDAHRGIEGTTEQVSRPAVSMLSRGKAAQSHVNGVGERIGVQCGIPVAELIAGVEAYDTQGGGIDDGAAKLLLGGTVAKRL